MDKKKVDVRLMSHNPTLWFLSGAESSIQRQQGVHTIVSPSDRQLSYELARIKRAEKQNNYRRYIICKNIYLIFARRRKG